MFWRIDPPIKYAFLLLAGVNVLILSTAPLAYAVDLAGYMPLKFSSLCMSGDEACIAGAAPRTRRRATAESDGPQLQTVLMTGPCMAGDGPCVTKALQKPSRWHSMVGNDREYQAAIPNENLSLYKTLSYVTGATLTDQIWYLMIASEAATTGGIFFIVNTATSAMMTYNYEYYWNICCRTPPGPEGIVPVSATKAAIYRALSIIRVGALALVFGNTLPSAAVVTLAITLTRTAVYVTNDFVWNRIEVKNKYFSDLIFG